MDNQNNLNTIIDIVYLTPENADFSLSENQFLQLKAKIEVDGKEAEGIFFERVFLHRAFPFDNPYKFISVMGVFPKPPEEEGKEGDNSPAPPPENTTSFGDLKEIGIIAGLEVFGETVQGYLMNELDRKYFTPVIESIISVKDKYGFSYWEAKTSAGKTKFTVNDAYRNIIKINDDRIIINDVNGNRYEIQSLKALDRQSYGKIEIYL